ncbi:MAG: hypothetical protein QXX17_00455 [Conexivisphaerales archaeon]
MAMLALPYYLVVPGFVATELIVPTYNLLNKLFMSIFIGTSILLALNSLLYIFIPFPAIQLQVYVPLLTAVMAVVNYFVQRRNSEEED